MAAILPGTARERDGKSNTNLAAVGFASLIGLAIWGLWHVAAAQTVAGHAWVPDRKLYGCFGALAVLGLWLVSAAITSDWNIFALAMGQDKTLSTSKMQALLWTATVAFVYVTIYADRSISLPESHPFDSIPNNVLIALGLSLTTVVAAKSIASSQAAANPDSKPQSAEKSYDLSALVRNDGSDVASLTKVQMLFWTVVAMVVYVVTTFKDLGFLAQCVPPTPNCGLPDIDTSLMIFMGLGHATYLGGKLAATPQPLLAKTALGDADPAGTRTVTLSGSNLGATGTVTLDGAPLSPANLCWSPTVVKFTLPPTKTDGSAWNVGDSTAVGVTVGDAASASLQLRIT